MCVSYDGGDVHPWLGTRPSPHRRFVRTRSLCLDLRILGCRVGDENSVFKVFCMK